MNPGISVSRVGGNAQIKAMKKVSGPLKLAYAQYRELQSFAQFGSDLDDDTKRRLAQGERIVEVLKQGRNEPMPVEQQVVIIYAVVHDLLRNIPVSRIKTFEKQLLEFISVNHSEITEEIKNSGILSDENANRIKDVVLEYSSNFTDGSL